MTTQHMTGRTMSMTLDPTLQNPITSIVASMRATHDDPALLPNGGRVRDAGRRRVDALMASGLYSL